jgi:hypothetical protein
VDPPKRLTLSKKAASTLGALAAAGIASAPFGKLNGEGKGIGGKITRIVFRTFGASVLPSTYGAVRKKIERIDMTFGTVRDLKGVAFPFRFEVRHFVNSPARLVGIRAMFAARTKMAVAASDGQS